MRARAKIVENARERDEIEMQRVRLLELANMNEQQRLERQAQFKRVRNDNGTRHKMIRTVRILSPCDDEKTRFWACYNYSY